VAKRWNEPKDPDEVLDYVVDWEASLAGDIIAMAIGVLKCQDTPAEGVRDYFLS
jgi:hypothetical protein